MAPNDNGRTKLQISANFILIFNKLGPASRTKLELVEQKAKKNDHANQSKKSSTLCFKRLQCH